MAENSAPAGSFAGPPVKGAELTPGQRRSGVVVFSTRFVVDARR
jgi:hypothetical protein